jgi:hypothetical protein
VIIGIAGGGLVVLNVSSIAIQSDLNPGGLALSAIIGGILIDRTILN